MTSLGPVEHWPQSLRIAVRMCLDARFPMTIWAGSELVLIYNDGYPPVLGAAKHPWALGRPAREVWGELWERLGPELERVMRDGESTVHEDERFVLRRRARDDECFFTYSFTPIQEEDGRIVGALNVFLETTERVRALRQRTALIYAITESSEDVFFAKDRDGRMLFANPAEFTVRLPLIPDASADIVGHTFASRSLPRRVLVIEDNLDAADSLRSVLELMGHVVAVAHDGTTGVAEARAFRPDVVLCDIGLPGIDGYAVARALRADERLRAVRLVALSGYALPEDLVRAAAAGFDQHVRKPPSIEKLEDALADAGRRPRVEPGSSTPA